MADEAKKPAARKTAARKTTPRKTEAKAAPKNEEADSAAFEKRVADEVARREAEAQEEQANTNPQMYIRNLHGSPVRIKLERHTPQQRGISLKPRGERGDLAPVQAEDFNDPVFMDNNGLLFEILDAKQAQEVVGKQTTNQQAVHPALAALRNENNQPYDENAFKVEKSFEDQGVVVAQLEDGQVAFDRGGIQRKRGEAPGTPSYVAGAEPGRAPANEEASYLSDQKAREKANTDLGLKVSVNPVQKT